MRYEEGDRIELKREMVKDLSFSYDEVKEGYIENYGTGIQRIMDGYQGTEYQDEFYVSNSYFMITLHSLNQIEPHDAKNDAKKYQFMTI